MAPRTPLDAASAFDPFSPAYLRDPYPHFVELREQPPFYAPSIGM